VFAAATAVRTEATVETVDEEADLAILTAVSAA